MNLNETWRKTIETRHFVAIKDKIVSFYKIYYFVDSSVRNTDFIIEKQETSNEKGDK